MLRENTGTREVGMLPYPPRRLLCCARGKRPRRRSARRHLCQQSWNETV